MYVILALKFSVLCEFYGYVINKDHKQRHIYIIKYYLEIKGNVVLIYNKRSTKTTLGSVKEARCKRPKTV